MMGRKSPMVLAVRAAETRSSSSSEEKPALGEMLPQPGRDVFPVGV